MWLLPAPQRPALAPTSSHLVSTTGLPAVASTHVHTRVQAFMQCMLHAVIAMRHWIGSLGRF